MVHHKSKSKVSQKRVADTLTDPVLVHCLIGSESWQKDLASKHVKYLSEDNLKSFSSSDSG